MSEEPTKQFATYEEFFAFYLEAHSNPTNRKLHAIGTGLGAAVGLAALLARKPKYVLLWPVISYGFAWTGHFFVEGNKPATFGHPLWSLVSDFRMLYLMVTGNLDAARAAKPEPGPIAAEADARANGVHQ